MKVFVTGASGYIGGAVSELLLRSGYEVYGLVRTDAAAAQLRERGVVPVKGTLDDSGLLADWAKASDAVVNAANADHSQCVSVLIDALRGSGKPLLHTSGSSVVGDDARGEFASDVAYDESMKFAVNPAKQARRDIDLQVLRSASKGIRTAVICPSLIYGVGKGINSSSVQIPFMVRNALERGAVEVVGRGQNVWSNVHIDDVAHLYQLILENARGQGFYFVENGEASYIALAQMLAKRLGVTKVEHLPPTVAAERWGVPRAYFSFGSNSRVRARRARDELGWVPVHSSVFGWISDEMPIPQHMN